MSNTYSGKLHKFKDGAILVDSKHGLEIHLHYKDIEYVWHNDSINVQLDKNNKLCHISITSRNTSNLIGKLKKETKHWLFIPEDNKIDSMYIDQKNINADEKKQLKDDAIVYVEIISYPSASCNIGIVKIIEFLGEFDNPNIEIEMAVKKYALPHKFNSNIDKELNKITDKVDKQKHTERIDLTDIDLITIDGEDARDFDDAVYCEPCTHNQKNSWRLIVAIADVSYYVKPNTAIDTEAVQRATSVYFPRKVIPMLPEKLSNGLCSLNPNVDRLCMVCDMVINLDGNIEAYQFYNAIMHSKARLTYSGAAKILNKYNAAPKQNKKLKSSNIDKVEQNLINLYGTYKALLGARHIRGAIDFDTTETQIIFNQQGKIDKIVPRTRNEAHKLIEECMLAANVCAADFLQQNKTGLYRVHGQPMHDKLIQLQQNLNLLGIQFSLPKSSQIHTKDISALLQKVQGREDSKIIQTMVLRTMQQAVYDCNNIGHYGLAYKNYTHFTSPIRRYPDLLVHRCIKAILNLAIYQPNIPRDVELHTLLIKHQQTHAINNKNLLQNNNTQNNKKNIWSKLGSHCSALERRADEASRDVEAWLKCYYMQDKIGQIFSGIISSILAFGLFVQLDNLFIDGLVHISDLGKDYFVYDEKKQQLYGKKSNKIYSIGDKITIQVMKVDISSRKIDFKIMLT